MDKLTAVLKVLKNKYILSIIVFLIWIAFFDRNDLITQHDRKRELNKLQTSTDFYEKEIAATKKDLNNLNNDEALLEKLAREKYYLKRANEEIFVIDSTTSEKK